MYLIFTKISVLMNSGNAPVDFSSPDPARSPDLRPYHPQHAAGRRCLDRVLIFKRPAGAVGGGGNWRNKEAAAEVGGRQVFLIDQHAHRGAGRWTPGATRP